MDSVLSVYKEIDKVLGKFNGLNDHSDKSLDELIGQLQAVQQDIATVLGKCRNMLLVEEQV